MRDIRFLIKLHKFKNSKFTGSELLNLTGEFYSYPKSLKIRKKILNNNIIVFEGVSKQDKRVKLYKLSNLAFEEMAKKFTESE